MDQMAERVRGLLSRLEARMTEMVEAEQSLSRLVQELDECTEVVLRRIGEEFGTLRQMLDRRQTELETKTRELRKSKRFMLEERMDGLSVLRSNLSLLCECAGEVQAQLSKSKSEPGSESKAEGERGGRGGKEDSRSGRNMDTQISVDVCLLEMSLRRSLSGTSSECLSLSLEESAYMGLSMSSGPGEDMGW